MTELAGALGLRDDSDYDGGDVGRVDRRRPSPVSRVVTVVGALLVGFLLAVGLSAGRTAALEQGERKGELIALINARQERADRLAEQLEQLRAEVAEAQRGTAAAGAPALNARVTAVEDATGLTALRGPGVEITFSDAEGACATGRAEDCRIQDVDLQHAVNILWSLGAEGIAINGERLVATTAIRSAGSAILVNYRVLSSPYVVAAVGDPGALEQGFNASQVAVDFAAWRDAYGLGFTVAPTEEMLLPAYAGALRLGAATAAGSSGP